MANNSSGFLVAVLGAAIVGGAAGFVGGQFSPRASTQTSGGITHTLETQLVRDVAALQEGAGQIAVPLVVREYITEQLQSVPHAETADRATDADWAENADHALNADDATFAEEADFANKADYARAAGEAGVAETADVAISAGAADFATNASRAERAAELIGGPPKEAPEIYVEDSFFGPGYLYRATRGNTTDDDDKEEPRAKRNIVAQGPVSLTTRRENIVAALATVLTLKESRPVYVALIDGSLTLDPGSRGSYQLLRNGQPILEGRLSNRDGSEEREIPAGAIHTIDFPESGQHVYTLRMIAQDGRIGILDVRLVALEL